MNEVFIDMRNKNEWIRKYFSKDIVSIADLISTIENISAEIEALQEEIEDREENIKENYVLKNWD